MQATGSQNAQAKVRAGGCPESGSVASLPAVFGLLVAYIAALAFALAGGFSLEKFEETMNIASMTGFILIFAASARRTVRVGGRSNASRASLPAAREGPMISKQGIQPSAEIWGSAKVIGFLND